MEIRTMQNTSTAKEKHLDLKVDDDEDLLHVTITGATNISKADAATALRYLANRLDHVDDHYWNTAILKGHADRVL